MTPELEVQRLSLWALALPAESRKLLFLSAAAMLGEHLENGQDLNPVAEEIRKRMKADPWMTGPVVEA